jgi:hypothetical protein
VLRKVLGLGAVVLFFAGPPACLNDEGPDRFTTTRCYEGDMEGCICGNQPTGIQFCDSSGKFSGECRCDGCSAFPDCGSCRGSCFDTCLCETVGKASECRVRCAKEGGS